MEREHRRAHTHESHMDTCQDCIRQAQYERYRFTDHAGRAWEGPIRRVVKVHPDYVWALVVNEATGARKWFELDNARLCALIERDLTTELD
jgi:hypothetical protein